MIRILQGDCREVLPTLAAGSVQCVVTSPPYYGLRDYGVAGQLGLEATPDDYIATMVAVFREVRRVLRDDGTCWVNMGDSYAGSWGNQGRYPSTESNTGNVPPGYKPKDLLMMPARLALALQADGWWIRSEITWCKGSPMPESVTDRPTSATEKVYLLAKRPKYFYDSIAIAEPCVSNHPSGNGYGRPEQLSRGGRGQDAGWTDVGGTRNARNWWVINSGAFPGAHFAVFPSALAERCIKAGTSERGCCAACGAPWVRQTSGWSPSCQCNADTKPCTLLDPFAGAGTVGLVADRLQRDAVLIELSPAYCAMLRARITRDAPLLVQVA